MRGYADAGADTYTAMGMVVAPAKGTATWRGGRRCEFPVTGVLGMLGVALILFEVILTHKIGRVARLGAACFPVVRLVAQGQHLPLLKSATRHWEGERQRVLEQAEEFALGEELNGA